MAGLLTFPPFTQFLDADGAPYAGGSLSSFTGGTTTPALTYSDPDLAGGHSNGSVITLDSAGRPSVSGTYVGIYIASGASYKFVLKNAAGATIHTQDLVNVANQSTVTIPSPSAPTQLIGTTDGSNWTAMTGIVPTGSVLMYGAAAAPTGWLLCDGTSYLRADYAALFTVVGTTYGSVDGTHFTVPDCRGTFPFFKAAAGTGSTLGGTFGAIDHLHTGPSHTHTGPSHTHTYTDTVSHTHSISITDGANTGGTKGDVTGGAGEFVTGFTRTSATNATGSTGVGATGTTAAGGTANTGASGTGNTGTANPPALVFTAIIKT